MTSSNGDIFRVTGHLCGEFTGPRWIPSQRPVTRSFDVFFHLRLNKQLSNQSWGWWFETPSHPWLRHRNVKSVFHGIGYSYHEDKTVVRPSYLYNSNPYTDKAKFLYWNDLLNPKELILISHARNHCATLRCNLKTISRQMDALSSIFSRPLHAPLNT